MSSICLQNFLVVMRSSCAGFMYRLDVKQCPAIWLLSLLILLSLTPDYLHAAEVFLREDFQDLGAWKPVYFPSIRNHTLYSIDTQDGESFLKAESRASASGIVFKSTFNVFEYPKARWRWKVSNVYKKGDVRTKAGDDYPIRIYVMFQYDPESAPLGKRIRYGIAKKLYGEYPPHSSLNYIWANKRSEEGIVANAYAGEARMIILERGEGSAGKWIEEEVNILDDYRKAFGEAPPSTATLAIMNDSDNTGEKAVSYLDYIEIFR